MKDYRKYRGAPIPLGMNRDTGRPIGLHPARLVQHMLVVGGTGSGKTVANEAMVRAAIRDRQAVIVLDPKGTMYKRLLAYCCQRGGSLKDRVYLIDPNDDRYRVGVNYFDLAGNSIPKTVSLIKGAIYRVMGRQDADLTITFERWGVAALSVLGHAGLSLADFYSVLTDDGFRERLLPTVADTFVQEEWQNFKRRMSAKEQEANLKAAINRSALFREDPALYQMVGQPNAIDWQAVMNDGGIVLVNLAPEKATQEHCRFLGIMLIHQLYHAALQRPEKYWYTPCYVFVDEFADIICGDFKDALQKVREFGLGMVLSLQNLIDLRGVDPDNPDAMLASMLQNTETKLALKCRNEDDAKALARHLYAPQVTGLEIKHTTVSALPHLSDETVVTHHSSSSRQRGGGAQDAEIVTPEGVLLQTANGTTMMDNFGESEGTTASTRQRIDYTYQDVPTYWTLEETFHRYAAGIMNQHPGEGRLLYATNRPVIPIKTILPKRQHVEPERLIDYSAEICERMRARSPQDAEHFIEQRRQAVLLPGRAPLSTSLPAPSIAIDLPPDRKTPTPIKPEHRRKEP